LAGSAASQIQLLPKRHFPTNWHISNNIQTVQNAVLLTIQHRWFSGI
jgi:hypothetical protein